MRLNLRAAAQPAVGLQDGGLQPSWRQRLLTSGSTPPLTLALSFASTYGARAHTVVINPGCFPPAITVSFMSRTAAVCAAVVLLLVLLPPSALAANKLPKHSFFTAGHSGSYTVTAGALYLRVRMVGGGQTAAAARLCASFTALHAPGTDRLGLYSLSLQEEEAQARIMVPTTRALQAQPARPPSSAPTLLTARKPVTTMRAALEAAHRGRRRHPRLLVQHPRREWRRRRLHRGLAASDDRQWRHRACFSPGSDVHQLGPHPRGWRSWQRRRRRRCDCARWGAQRRRLSRR
jgi:hypothetical protein